MNSNHHSTHENTAAQRAAAGTSAWEDAVRLQQQATPDHADFYALAGEIVLTLRAVDYLARLLRGQVAGYAKAQQAQSRLIYDDTREFDPIERLHVAVVQLEEVSSAIGAVADWANEFWSTIGHIGVEDVAR